MSNDTTQHTPADVRERVEEAWATVEAAALARANLLDSNFAGQPAKAAEIRNAVEQVAALLRTPRGEGEEVWPGDAENDASFLRSWARHLRTEAQDIREAQDRADWKQQAEYTEVAAARMDQIANRIAALRSDAQGEDRWEDLVFGPIVQAYNEAQAARTNGGNDATT